ncbi:MAG TPA: polysaccharide deacetylase family protein [Solirubrobacteraceae bacterium]|jgi:peptidoglycan/xylan/chitin deacetylase (PgdA/CDA1 family)|nr:polysaccharide deacetylase family protein [Solirubrobacteraceae bacterium]
MTVALIYHDVVAAARQDECGFPGAIAARYKLEPDRFEAHLDAIAATGVTIGGIGDGSGAALTFDDGGASALDAAEVLERRGWRGHFFVTTGRIGTPGFLTAAQVRELAERRHTVGSHSNSHPTYMGSLSAAELATEWRSSREALAEILGAEPDSAAVPGGFLSADVIAEAARAGYRLLLTSQPTTRLSSHDGMRVHGRFTIWAATTPARAAAYARGDRRALASLWIAWQAKTAPKRISPSAYEAVRRRWARRRQATG